MNRVSITFPKKNTIQRNHDISLTIKAEMHIKFKQQEQKGVQFSFEGQLMIQMNYLQRFKHVEYLFNSVYSNLTW